MRALLLVIIALLAMTACNTTRYVPYEVVRDHYHTKTRTDTVRERDSVSTRTESSGDTVRVIEERWHVIEHKSTVHDTVEVHDSIPYPVEVPANLTRWQQAKIELGGWAFGALGLALVVLMIRLVRRRKI